MQYIAKYAFNYQPDFPEKREGFRYDFDFRVVTRRVLILFLFADNLKKLLTTNNYKVKI